MPQNTRLLKTIVVVLGILLVAGFIVVIATIIIRLGNLGNETQAVENAKPAPPIGTGAGTYELPLAAAEKIKNITLDGSRMAVHVEGPSQARLLIVDLNNGSVAQTFLVTEPQD